jgi:hypothetical protein
MPDAYDLKAIAVRVTQARLILTPIAIDIDPHHE